MVTTEYEIGVVGAGATGGYLAAALANAGNAVKLFTRGQSLAHVREHGLKVTGPDGSFVGRPQQVVGKSDDFEPADLTLVCVKSYDTEEVADEIAPLVGDAGMILCLQNGIANEDVLADRYGQDRVLTGVLYIGAERARVGEIECSTPARVIFGPFTGGQEMPPVADWLEGALAGAGIECTVDKDIRQAKWQKFLFNCGLNPLTAITGMRLGPILETDDGRTLFESLVDEAIAVATAAGAPLTSDARAQVMATAARMDISSSMAEDLAAGRPLELDAFGGHVLRLAEQSGLAAPATETVTRILRIMDPARVAR